MLWQAHKAGYAPIRIRNQDVLLSVSAQHLGKSTKQQQQQQNRQHQISPQTK